MRGARGARAGSVPSAAASARLLRGQRAPSTGVMSRGFNSGLGGGAIASASVLLVPDCCTRVALAAGGWLAGQGAGFSLTWVCAVAGTRPSRLRGIFPVALC